MKSRNLLMATIGLFLITSCSGAVDPEPGPDGTTLIFRNQGTVPIVSAGASTCDDMREWPNNLKSPLAPGTEITLHIYKECWDLHAQFQDGREKIQWAVQMSKGQSYTWLIN